jgi:hypothetical protein
MRFGKHSNSWLLSVGVACALACPTTACSVAGAPKQASPAAGDPLEGMTQENMTHLTNAPAFATGVLTVTVGAGELALVGMRASDKSIIVNGVLTAGANSTTVKTVKVVEDSHNTGTKEVVLDFTNGFFAAGTSSAGSGIVLNLGNGTNTLGVRGTPAADTFRLGLNGFSFGADKYLDVSWASGAPLGKVTNFVVSMGAGNDSWSASGDSVTGSVFVNGTHGVTVYGGKGNDTFNEGSVLTSYESLWGGGDSGDTVDYSGRTNALTITMGDGSANDGENGEHDNIEADLLVVNGGSGNDTMTPGATAGYVLNGNGGNDTFSMGTDATCNADCVTACTGADVHPAGSLKGGAGTDTVDFSSRTVCAIAVTMDGATQSGASTGAPLVVAENMLVGTDVENIVGTGLADTIVGNAADNVITGGAGADTLSGLAGNDTFAEGTVQNGGDTFNGGADTDTVDYSGRTAGIWAAIDGQAHSGEATSLAQTIGTSGATPAYSDATCASGGSNENDQIMMDVENIYGGTVGDCLYGQPAGTTDCTANGGSLYNCANELVGGGGGDLLWGYDDDDTLQGGGGTAADGLDCGGGQGNIGYNAGSGGYKMSNCQL